MPVDALLGCWRVCVWHYASLLAQVCAPLTCLALNASVNSKVLLMYWGVASADIPVWQRSALVYPGRSGAVCR